MNGAAFFWFLFSAGGVLVVLVILALWVALRPSSKLARRVLLIAIAAFTVGSIYAVPDAVGRLLGSAFRPLGANDAPAGNTAVVLLASGNRTMLDWSGSTLSVLDWNGAERTLEAARVFHLIHPAFIISSGGVLTTREWIEAPALTMRTALLELGVPDDRIIIERESRTTREEAEIVARMLPALHVDHVVLVTSALHMRRSVGTFRAVGIDVIPAVAKPSSPSSLTTRLLPSDTGLRATAEVMHELLGLVYYRLRGWYR